MYYDFFKQENMELSTQKKEKEYFLHRENILKYRYVFQHKDTNELYYDYFTLKDLEDNMLNVTFEEIGNDYKIIGRDQYTGFKDRLNNELYLKDFVQHDFVSKYTPSARTNQRFIILYTQSKTKDMKLFNSLSIEFLNIDGLDEFYTKFIINKDLSKIGDVYKNYKFLEKQMYRINL